MCPGRIFATITCFSMSRASKCSLQLTTLRRAGKIGGVTLRSIGQIARLERIVDNDKGFVVAQHMLAELREENAQLTIRLGSTHVLCDDYGDVASASLIENWIDEAEDRASGHRAIGALNSKFNQHPTGAWRRQEAPGLCHSRQPIHQMID
jgi:hypothetical protein